MTSGRSGPATWPGPSVSAEHPNMTLRRKGDVCYGFLSRRALVDTACIGSKVNSGYTCVPGYR
eukprot:1001577-Rhodomonas_salina.1